MIVSLPVLFEVIFVATLAVVLLNTEEVADRFDSSKDALMHYHGAEEALVESLLTVMNIDGTSKANYSDEFDTLLRRMRDYRNTLQAGYAVRSEIREALQAVPEMFDRASLVVQRVKEIFKHPANERWTRAKGIETDIMTLMSEAKPISDRISIAEERMQGAAPAELHQLRLIIFLTTAFGLMVSLVMTIVVAGLFFQNVAKKLEIIEENAQRVAIGVPLHEPLKDKDEIGELDAALHKAADLIADASKKEFAILINSVDVLCSLDTRLRIVDIGQSVSRAWHHNADDLLGRSILTLVPPHDRPRLTSLLEEASHQEKEFELETQLLGGDGSLKDILWKISWSQADKSFYCVAHDITERRNLARKKQQLISVAGHDLRTPLTSVSGTLAVVTEGVRGSLSAEARTELIKASQSLELLMELIRDLLDLEKLDAGKMVLEFNCVSALDVCSLAIESVDSLARKHNIEIQPPYKDASMLGDERRLVQILINFLSNAIKFSEPGDKVSVAVKEQDGFVELSVLDHGAGVAVQEQELIFEKLHQSKSQSSEDAKSTGLGLPIVKVLAEAHHGSVGVDSEYGKGSRFFVRIPVFVDDSDELDAEE